jgi:Membrane proteins related to metalloendopeptidases
VIGRSRNSQWFARWAPAVLLLVGTLLISSLASNDGSSRSSPGDPQMESPPPTVIDSIRSRAEIPKLRALRKAFLHLPARPPISDSIWVLSSQYGPRRDPLTHEDSFHAGVDLAAQSGTPIMPPARGVVTSIGRSDRSGLYLRLKHPPLPYQSSFAHLSTVTVQRGDTVSLRDTIATVGKSGRTTGPHLHFRVERNRRPVDPARLYQQYVSLRDSFRAQARRSRRLVQRSLRRARQTPDTMSYSIVPHLLDIQSRVQSLARVPRMPKFFPRSSAPDAAPRVSSAPNDSLAQSSFE